jgi:DNA-binding NarL/FixJ family response regulator
VKRLVPTIIIDERILSRQGVASLLHGTDYKVIASISSLSALRDIKPPADRPLLAVVGFSCSPCDTLKLVGEVHRLLPGSKVVAVGECFDGLDLAHVQDSGIDGIVFDVDSSEALLKAFDLALLGQQLVIMKPSAKTRRESVEDPASLNGNSHTQDQNSSESKNGRARATSASFFRRSSLFFEQNAKQ